MKVTSVVCIGLIFISSLLAVGCGILDSSKEATVTITPKPIATIKDAVQQADGSFLVTYTADLDGTTFECRLESSATGVGDWEVCPDTGSVVKVAEATIFAVRGIKNGQAGEAATRLLNSVPGGTFQAVILEKASVQQVSPDAPELTISFVVEGLAPEEVQFFCVIGTVEAEQQCSSPLRVVRLENGEFPQVTVTPVRIANQERGISDTIHFTDANVAHRTIESAFGIGSNYEYVVPAGMHVTQYATNETKNGGIEAYQIRNDSDPFYVGSSSCSIGGNADFYALSPAGRPLRYCTFAPTATEFGNMLEGRWSYNHISIATDPEVVMAKPQADETIVMNLFSANAPVQRENTRFWDLCSNAIDGKIDVYPSRHVGFNFWGEEVRADFWSCTKNLNTRFPGGFGKQQTFRVGAFFIANGGSGALRRQGNPELIVDMNCGECTYRFEDLLEVVHIGLVNAEIETQVHHANYVLQTFQKNLRAKNTPPNWRQNIPQPKAGPRNKRGPFFPRSGGVPNFDNGVPNFDNGTPGEPFEQVPQDASQFPDQASEQSSNGWFKNREPRKSRIPMPQYPFQQ